jgi:UDP-N-acetylmuramoyl-L-alanyl-D-glutamate--2,6-diaminopimelate ligase
MRLAELLGVNTPQPPVEIHGLTADSRAVRPGFLFAALPGTRADGAGFIPEALARGAVAVLARPEVACSIADVSTICISDDNPRRRLALLAARFFEAQPEPVVAVTGTNGKTSVVDFTRQIWERLGENAASLGTLGVIAGAERRPLAHTTPDPVSLHAELAALAAQGVTHAAIEASSHGLAQFRVDGVRVAAAALTNVTRDHLDYHPSFTAYRDAKFRLFGEVMAPGGTAVLNMDAPIARAAAELCWSHGHRVLGVGELAGDLRLSERIARPDGQHLALVFERRRWPVNLPLVGAFQAHNAAMAAALVIGCGAAPEPVFEALAHLRSVPGRLERVLRRADGAAVYVDYAHTPDALAQALQALRPHAQGRLQVVFGCGGDRDAGKRPQMGEVAAALADRTIVTDDNPRSEPPAAIRAAIRAACPAAVEIGDRAEAIRTGLSKIEAGDVLLVAGKGHETGQIVGARVLPFDDREVVRRMAAELGMWDG